MGDIVKIEKHDIETHDPERHRLKVAALDYSIEEAKRIKDWPALESAVDEKILEQRKFVSWWQAAVSSGKGTRTDLNRERGFSLKQAESLTGMKQQRVSDLGKRLSKLDKYRAHLLGVEFRAAFLDAIDNIRGTQGTGENEWYTPPKYIELARQVMGDIDLDPASSERAQEIVGARKFFSAGDDGLHHEWHGRVWLNPPYAQPLIAHFVEKMVEERSAGRVTAAIMLTHNYTDTSWFHKGAEIVDAICFTRGRIPFLDADGGTCAPTQGQAFFYYGDDVAKFASVFLEVGFVVAPYHGI